MKKKPSLQEFMQQAGLSPNVEILSEESRARLVESLVATHGKAALTSELVDQVFGWAELTDVTHGMLQNVLDGTMDILVKDGEVAFRVSAKGDAVVKQMIRDQKEQG